MSGGIHPDDFDAPGPPVQPSQASAPPQPPIARVQAESPPTSPQTISKQYLPNRPIISPPPSGTRGNLKWLALVMAFALIAFVVWKSMNHPSIVATPVVSNAGTAPQVSAANPSALPSAQVSNGGGAEILDRRILGRWRQVNAEEDVLEPEFFPDGTMQQHNESGRFTGKYSFIDVGTVKIDGLSCPCGISFQGGDRELYMTLKFPSGTEMRFKLQGQGVPPDVARSNSLIRVTSYRSRDVNPVWASGGKILFLSNRGGERANQNNVWEAQPDGTGQHELVHVRVSTPPEWGDPGLGGHLELGDSGDIFVYEAQHFHEIMEVVLPPSATTAVRTILDGNDGSFRVLLQVPGGQSASGVFFSRSTRRAAWIATIPGQSVQIRSAPLASLNGQSATTHGERVVEVGASGSVEGMTFSPDGSQLAAAICWSSCSGGNRGPDLYILDVRSGRVLVQLTNTGQNGIRNSSPRWNPNGQWLAFTSTATGHEGIWLIKRDGTGLRQLNTASMKALAPAWSDDGSNLVFSAVSDGNENIWIAQDALSLSADTQEKVVRQPGNGSSGTNVFIGQWRNEDANTNWMSRVVISGPPGQLTVHTWGRCGAGECDGGEAVSSPEGNGLRVVKQSVARDGTAWANRIEILMLENSQRLQLTERTQFIDNSGRPNQERTGFFRKD